MCNPELAGGIVAAGQREAALGLRVREKGRIEIESHAAGFGPIDPAGKVFGPALIALDLLSPIVGIDGVQIQPVLAGNQAQRLVQIRTQLVSATRLAGIIARRLNAAAGQPRRALKTPNIITLPAVQRDADALEGL